MIEAEGDVGGVPPVGSADEALGGAGGEFECGDGKDGKEDEEQGFHGMK
jgi:hypothetical protein